MINLALNETWERYLKDNGADFAYFVDISSLPQNIIEDYACAVLFGKTLSRKFINILKAGQKPKPNEVLTIEQKMEKLAAKLAGLLETEGYKSISKLKFARLPHKTVALMAGLGFIGKNNLLVNEQYGCALMLGKVLTAAPFVSKNEALKESQCGDCTICADVCPTKSLLGNAWAVTTSRDEMMVRKRCIVCAKCMVWCPYTENYARQQSIE